MVVKFVVTTALIALLSFVLGLFLPWWTIAIAAFAVSALIPQRPIPAFFSGFAALFLLWGLLALVADLRNESILSARVAAVLPLGGSSVAILLVTAFVGALVGGGGSLTAAFCRK
jgi:hypothetical protein